MKKCIMFVLSAVLFLNAETLFQVKDSSNRVVLDVSSDGLRVLNQGDTVMVISSTEIKAVIDNSKALSRSFSVATSTSAKGKANVLEVTTQDTKMREGTGGDQYTAFSPENTFIGLRSGILTNPNLYPTDNYGKRNIFIGYESGRNNIIGYQNVFIGDSTGYNTAATTSTTQNAVRNVFIGTSSGFWNKEGDVNTFVGYLAGYSNNKNGGSATGICNTYIGANSGRANIDGTFNTFMGYYSGYKMTGGASNVMLGQRSGQNKTSGDNNTLVGANAGSNSSTGSGNVFLGYNSGYYETGSNKLYISNSTTSTPLIKGTFPNVDLDLTATNINLNGKLNGNLNSETTSGNNFLRVTSPSASSPGIEFFRPGAGSNDWRIYNTSGNLRIGVSGDDLATVTDMVHIALGGNVGIGNTSPGQKLDITAGYGRVQSGYSWLTNSDIRYKTNVSTLNNALANVLKMRGVRYDLKDESNIDQNNGKHIGFIAQELEEVYPEFVVEDENNYKSVAYDKVNAVLVEAIKEQQNKINDLEAENKKLLSRIESIEAILKK